VTGKADEGKPRAYAHLDESYESRRRAEDRPDLSSSFANQRVDYLPTAPATRAEPSRVELVRERYVGRIRHQPAVNLDHVDVADPRAAQSRPNRAQQPKQEQQYYDTQDDINQTVLTDEFRERPLVAESRSKRATAKPASPSPAK